MFSNQKQERHIQIQPTTTTQKTRNVKLREQDDCKTVKQDVAC